MLFRLRIYQRRAALCRKRHPHSDCSAFGLRSQFFRNAHLCHLLVTHKIGSERGCLAFWIDPGGCGTGRLIVHDTHRGLLKHSRFSHQGVFCPSFYGDRAHPHGLGTKSLGPVAHVRLGRRRSGLCHDGLQHDAPDLRLRRHARTRDEPLRHGVLWFCLFGQPPCPRLSCACSTTKPRPCRRF